MPKATDIFSEREKTYSFELFPPRTDKGFENLKTTIAQLAALKPDFFSCTYGAGGSSRGKTFDITELIEKEHGITAVAHLTCVCHTKEEIKSILEDIKGRGLSNILALRGDPPQDNPGWTPGPDNFQYSSDLCAFVRANFQDHFGIGVAGFPEGHPLSPDRDTDAKVMKTKIDNGADFIITQLFFDNRDYFNYVDRLRGLGVLNRVIPGIIPITDYDALLRFCGLCGATVTKDVRDIFEPLRGNPDAVLQAGIDFAVRQCKDLLNNGAPGLHFYCLNKLHPVDAILREVRGS